MGEINISAGTNYENPASALVSHRRKKGLGEMGFCPCIFSCFSYFKKCSFGGGGVGGCGGVCV